MAKPTAGSTVWTIKTSQGFIDHCRYKTVTALMPTRRLFWRSEKAARKAFDNIQNRFPRLGPCYELFEATMTESYPGWLTPEPIRLLDTKTIA